MAKKGKKSENSQHIADLFHILSRKEVDESVLETRAEVDDRVGQMIGTLLTRHRVELSEALRSISTMHEEFEASRGNHSSNEGELEIRIRVVIANLLKKTDIEGSIKDSSKDSSPKSNADYQRRQMISWCDPE